MGFGEAAIPMAIAPMDIGTGQMDMSVTETSVGEAPMAVAGTAMRIGAGKAAPWPNQ